MPYKSISELPPATKKLPAGAKKIWMAAFNAASASEDYDEKTAFAIAMAAVKKKYKKVGEEWMLKDGVWLFGDDDDENALVDVQLEEILVLDQQNVRFTDDGYLVASSRIARTGIQIYQGSELGRPEMKEVRVYRPADEVFSKKAMESLAWKPITLNHPDKVINSNNWRKHAVGQVSDEIARDGEFIRVPLILMDQTAINATKDGIAQLSVGYDAKLKWGEGQTDDGQFYDAVQSQIRANHIALVSQARGGPRLRIGDNQQKETTMERVFNLDGVNIQLDEKDGQILERHLSTLTTKLKDAEVTVTSALAKMADLQKAIETRDGEIIGLTKKLADAEWTPEKRDQAIRTSMEIFDRARRVLGDKLITDGKTDIAIKREVVAAEIGDEETKAMSDEAVDGVFRAVTRETKKDDGLRRTADALSRPLPQMNASQLAHQKYVERLGNAYKQKTA